MGSELLAPVNHYGIHQSHGMAFIHQKRDGTGTDIVTQVQSPFIVELGRSSNPRCPHHFSYPYDAEEALSSLKLKSIFRGNELIQAMLPKVNPSPVVAYVGSTEPFSTYHVFQRLLTMCNPIGGDAVRVYQKGDEKKLLNELRLTNIMPLVLIGFDTRLTNILHEMIQIAHLGYRNVIFVGDTHIPLGGKVSNLTRFFTDAERFVDINYNTDLKAVGSAIMMKEALAYAETFTS